MPLRRAKRIAKQTVRVIRRRQGATERINSGQFHVAIELFAECEARSPTTGRASVISKAGGEIILKIVRGGQVAAPAENGHVPVIVMEACNLECTAGTELSFRRNFFMQTVLQHRMALPPEQRGECVKFIERRRKCAAWLRIIRFERTGSIGHRGENKGGAPIIVEEHIQLRARTE